MDIRHPEEYISSGTPHSHSAAGPLLAGGSPTEIYPFRVACFLVDASLRRKLMLASSYLPALLVSGGPAGRAQFFSIMYYLAIILLCLNVFSVVISEFFMKCVAGCAKINYLYR